MPPVGEVFIPKTELSREQKEQDEIFDAKRAEIARVMSELAPPIPEGNWLTRQCGAESAVARYDHPELPEGECMSARVQRVLHGTKSLFGDDRQEVIELIVLPTSKQTGKYLRGGYYAKKAWVDEDGRLGVTHITGTHSFEQRMEGLDEIADTLQLIAEATQTEASNSLQQAS